MVIQPELYLKAAFKKRKTTLFWTSFSEPATITRGTAFGKDSSSEVQKEKTKKKMNKKDI